MNEQAERCAVCSAYLPQGKALPLATHRWASLALDNYSADWICEPCLTEINRRCELGHPLWDMERDRRPLWLPALPLRSF